MSLIADFARLTTNAESLASALKTAYAAAVQQLQITNELEKKARAAALAMIEVGKQAEQAAAKMQQVAGLGTRGGTNLYGKDWSKVLGYDISDQLAQANQQTQTLIKDALDKAKDPARYQEVLDFLTTKISASEKWAETLKASFATTEAQLDAAKAAMDAVRGTPGYSNAQSTYLNLLKVVQGQEATLANNAKNTEALQAVLDKLRLGGSGALSDGAAETYTADDLNALIVAAFKKNPYGISEEIVAKVVAAQYDLRDAPGKTYQLDLTAGTQKLSTITDQDPQQFLAALTQLLENARRSAV